jgi:CRP-like cAMP-binding protein
MTEFQLQNSAGQIFGRKSIPEHIIDGSISIDSIDAFGSILKQYPKHPGLVKKYSDLLLRMDLLDLAAKSYSEASQLFIASGKLLQAVVAKKLQWLIKPPPNKEVHNFLSAIGRDGFVDSPLKLFFDKLSAREKLAIISSLERTHVMAGKSLKKAGTKETDLYFVVSGTLKDSIFASLETRETVYRKSNVYLSDDDFFGKIYPFRNDHTSASDIITVTQVEMVKISKQKLSKLCRYYPNIEMALIHLFKIRSKPEQKSGLNLLRKAERYSLPVKMVLEIPVADAAKNPIAIEGYSSDISINGICVVLNGNSEHIPDLLSDLQKDDLKKKIRVSFPGSTMALKVQGKIVWRHQIHFNGHKTLALGIQFDDDTPQMRGMLFMFARSLGAIESTRTTA